jgi:urate oxidase
LIHVPVKIAQQSYGKSSVRLTKVIRRADRHDLVELNVNIMLHGDFARSYTHGDNTGIVATDSMKNTVYVLAKKHPIDSPEAFALHVADHFLASYPQVSVAEVNLSQSSWQRISVAGQPHPTAFASGGAEMRIAKAAVHRSGNNRRHIQGGLDDLLILKTTDSGFIGFVRDRFTTLPETTDRILATVLSADWTFKDDSADFNRAFGGIRTAMLEAFAQHKSLAVQQTLHAMAEAALDTEPAIVAIELRMPNKHRVPFNFKPFGLEFEQDIFITTDEPSGQISAKLQRS